MAQGILPIFQPRPHVLDALQKFDEEAQTAQQRLDSQLFSFVDGLLKFNVLAASGRLVSTKVQCSMIKIDMF